jgi:Lar family restriction alleviation protein
MTGAPLPCPFCGGTPSLNKELRPGYAEYLDDPDAHAFFYSCNSCAAVGGWMKSETSALRMWNMRTPLPAAPESSP